MAKLREIRFRKTNTSQNGEMEFDQDMLTVLMAIDASKTLLEVAKETKMDSAAFKKCFLKIYNLNLVEEVVAKVDCIDQHFLNNIKTCLVELLGPLGEILMEDAAEKINSELPDIPKKSIADFIHAIAIEIPGEKQRTEFQKIMLKNLKNQE
jgi:hypothetical protein